MFRLSGKQDETIEWDNVLSLLEDDDQLAAIEKKFPATERNSFLDSLRHLNPDLTERLRGAGRQLNSAAKLVNWPTVAVAGMLNSGKTSLVATFLSEEGRSRSLR